MSWVSDGGPDNTAQRYVLKEIADFADDHGVAFPGISLLAERTAQSERNVLRVVNDLEKDGWLRIRRRGTMVQTDSGNKRLGNLYCINTERVRARAEQVRAERKARRTGNSSPDKLSWEHFANHTKQATSDFSPDNLSPKEAVDEGDIFAFDEPDALPVQKPVDFVDFQADGGNLQVTNTPPPGDNLSGLQVTNTPPPGDKCCLLNKKNHQGTTMEEPSVDPPSPPYPPRGVVPTFEKIDITLLSHADDFARMRAQLRQDLDDVPLGLQGTRFKPIADGESDWNACFREWTLEGIFQVGQRHIEIRTSSADAMRTRKGIARYTQRLSSLAKQFLGTGELPVYITVATATEQVA
jgi:hypothetical protein